MRIVESTSCLAPRPTRLTLFLRRFVVWQLVRFIVINLKMTVMIAKSHGKKRAPRLVHEAHTTRIAAAQQSLHAGHHEG